MARVAPLVAALAVLVALAIAGSGAVGLAGAAAKPALLVVKVNSLEADVDMEAAYGTLTVKCTHAAGATTCTATVKPGSSADVTVYPNQNWTFTGWGGACENTPKPAGGHAQEFTCKLRVKAPRTVATANMFPRL